MGKKSSTLLALPEYHIDKEAQTALRALVYQAGGARMAVNAASVALQNLENQFNAIMLQLRADFGIKTGTKINVDIEKGTITVLE